jgi:di/tricarboxylate transporter
MEFEIVVVWFVLLAVMVLLAIDRFPPEGVALSGLLVLVVVGILSPAEFLSGLSSPAVVVIAALLVLSGALESSGVVRQIVDWLHRIAGNNERRLLVAGTVVPGVMSGVINVMATVSVFIPVLLRIALKARQSPSTLLLPMAYVSMAGANLTLIGSSSNLVVNDILRERTDSDFSLLEFAPIGFIMIVITTVYVLLAARSLLPKGKIPVDDSPEEQTRALIDRYEFSERVWEIDVQAGSPIVGSEIGDLRLMEDYGLSLISLVRADHRRPHLERSSTLEAGDILLLGGRRDRVDALVNAVDGLELSGAPAHRDEFSAGSAELIEVMVPPRSPAIGRTVRELDLRGKADLTAIALWRGEPLRTDVETTALQAGDALLLYGNKRYTRAFDPEPEFRWLHFPKKDSASEQARHLAPWTTLIFLAVILVAAVGWMPIAVTAVAGALGVTLIGALKAGRAYSRIDWRMLVLIAAMLPFATALNNSGASDAMAHWLTGGIGHLGPLAVMGAIALVTLSMTQVLHNAAAAAVMSPVAIDAALQLGVNPKTFALAVIVAASMSVLLPTGHPAPLLVRESGGYKNGDYLRFGSGMLVLTLVVILVFIPLLWPFQQ